jgi:hypothetical protein
VASQKARFLLGQAREVVAEMKLHLEPASVDDPQAPVRVAWRYFSNRLDQLDYPRALALNLPVGSGEVESSHRYLVQARLKRPGAWWRADMAQAMINLRVMRHNQLWETYWEKALGGASTQSGLKPRLPVQHFRSHPPGLPRFAL